MSNLSMHQIFKLRIIAAIGIFLCVLPHTLPAQFLFQDATNSARINMKYSGIYDGGPGVIVFDLNGDGWDDIFMAGGLDSNKLYLNMKDGTFRDITPDTMKSTTGDSVGTFRVYTRGGIAFDYNNDGFTDIYNTCEGRDILWRNNGDGTFTDVTRWPALLNLPLNDNQSMSATFGDFDGDGWNDFYVARWISESCFTTDNMGVDDGYCHRGFPNYFYVNNHDGSFTNRATEYGVDGDTGNTNIALFFDYDRDGDLDLIIGNDFGVELMPNRVWKNMLMETGKPTFVEVTDQIGLGCRMFNMSIAPCDYNRDGQFDFFETTFGPDSLMRNNGDGTFTSVQNTVMPKGDGFERGGSGFWKVSWTAISGDFDNDGWDDEFVVHGYEQVFPQWQTDYLTSQDTSMFYHNDHGIFTDYTDKAMNGHYISMKARGGAYLDYNNDGKLDLCIGAISQSAADTTSNFRLLENITPSSTESPAHWLEMRFTAVRTAKEAIGTIVDVWTGGIVHSRQVSTGGGFGSQNSLMQHVGLGQYSHADSIIVYWPADKHLHRQIDRYYNIPGDLRTNYIKADTILHFTEQVTKGVAEGTPLNNQIEVYPSPARDVLKVIDLKPSSSKHFEIYDMLGRKQMDFSGPEDTYSISVNELKSGCYLLRVTANGVMETKQFIKD